MCTGPGFYTGGLLDSIVWIHLSGLPARSVQTEIGFVFLFRDFPVSLRALQHSTGSGAAPIILEARRDAGAD